MCIRGRDSVAYGDPHADDAAIVAAAKAAAAHEFIAELPQGYDTRIGERGLRLSGGQRQRVAIARALIMDPKFLLLDEPTSALDVSTQDEILTLLTRLRGDRGLGFILVSHDLGVVTRLCDHIAVMRDGAMIETVSRDALRSGQGLSPYTRELRQASRGTVWLGAPETND